MTTVRRHRLRAVLLAGVAMLCATSVAAAAGEPVNQSAPVVTRAELELTTTDGSWIGQTQPFTYAWLRCPNAFLESCSPIPGEEGSTYTLRREDIGARIRSRVTASNAAGSASEPSAEVGPVTEGLFPAAAPDPEPEPEPRPALLRPKPVVTIGGLRRGRFTFVNELSVTGPEGALVRLRCRGRGCPVRRISTRIPRRGRVRLRRAQRTYRAGALLQIRVVDPQGERIGKFTGARFRSRGRTPRTNNACLEPGERSPSPCPAGL